jgi:hypothetical protein
LTTRLEKTKLSEKMIEELKRVQPNWVLGLRDVRIKVKRVLPSSFLAQTITKRKKHSSQPKPTTHPIPGHPLTL